jgi:hypothetical protein
MAPGFIGDPGYVASFWPLNQSRHFPSRFQPEARKSNNPLNLFLSLVSTLTLFGDTLAMPPESVIEARQLTVQCGPLWTYIGLCRIRDTYYSLNFDYCSDPENCYCNGTNSICPSQYSACSSEDVAYHCAGHHCTCQWKFQL